MKSKQASPKNLKENEFFGIVEGSKYRKRWKRVNTVLSVAMAVITLGLLILPAITQNSGDDPANPSAYSLTEHTLSMSDGATTGNRISDPVTLNNWRKYFGADEKGNISTEFAGGIRNDKSVTTSTLTYGKAGGSESTLSANPGNFLVGLSTMASTQTVAGMKSAPVDVMFVLDLSSSMYNSSNVDPTTVINMVDAVNKSITHLNELNPNNRVGVVVYYGYGYVDKQSDSSYSKIILPLARYSNSSDPNKFLGVSKSGSKLSKVYHLTTLTYTNKASSVTYQDYTVPTKNDSVAGTYAQLGILDALSEFQAVQDTTVPRNDGTGLSDPRRPVFVFMSDGMPTAATENYSQKSNATMGNNQEDSRHAAQTDFVTQLTASYAKECVEVKYKESTAAGNLPLYYTLGLTYKGSKAVSMDVMDPGNANTVGSNYDKQNRSNFDVTGQIQDYWEDLLAGDGQVTFKTQYLGSYTNIANMGTSTNVRTHTVGTVTIPSTNETFPSDISQKLYVDKFFEAETEDELQDAFADIMIEISLQQPYDTTLTKTDFDHEGYVTFVDTIGEYMSVSKIEGLIVEGHLYNGLPLAQNFPSTDGVEPSVYRLSDEQGNETQLGIDFVINVGTQLGLSPHYDETQPPGSRGNDDYKTAMQIIDLAYKTGQFSYKSDTDYSNYIEWWASVDTTGKHTYCGFYHGEDVDCGQENCNHTTAPAGATYRVKSYFYLAPTDSEDLGTGKSSNVMYSMIWVRTDISSGQQSVIFALPNALLPTVDFFIGLDMEGSIHRLEVSGATSPALLAYQVGLSPDVSVEDIIESNPTYFGIQRNEVNEVTSVNFYSNAFDKNNPESTTNTFVYFTPSNNNGRYYYTGPVDQMAGADTPIYKLKAGAVEGSNKDDDYERVNSPPTDDEAHAYYEHYRYFTATVDADGKLVPKNGFSYRRIAHSAVQKAKEGADGYWIIPAGTPHAMTTDTLHSGFDVEKTDNITGTAETSDRAYVNVTRYESDGTYIVGALLGNNGRLTVEPLTFSGTKTLEGVSDKSKYIFDFEMYETGADFTVPTDSVPYMTVHNTGENYDSIIFDTMWLDTGQHYFVVKEKEYPGISCDNTVYKISVTVTADMKLDVVVAKSIQGESAGENVGVNGLNFKNSARIELPSTGGIGTYIFTYGGLLLILLSCVGLIINWFLHRKEVV